MPDPDSGGLRGRFPALARLDRARRRRVPFVQQMEAADCGAACLTMVLAYHGKLMGLREVRERTGSGRGGVSARAILTAARGFGLRGRGVRLEPEDLHHLPPGSILHWGFNHFVVFERVTRKGVRLVDPAAGPRLVPLDRLREQFTGVALTLGPGEEFEPGGRTPATLSGYLARLGRHRGLLLRVFVISLLLQGFALSLPLLTSVLVDHVVPHEDPRLLTVLCMGLGIMVGFHVVASLLRSHLLLYLRTVLDTQLSLGFMDHLVRLPYAYFLERPAGDLMVRYESNRTLRERLTASALSTIFDGSLVGLYVVLIFAVSPKMGLLVTGLGGLQVLVYLASRRRYRELTSRDLEVQSRSQSQLVEMLAGMETLKASGAEGRAVERWSHRFVDELNVGLARGRLAALVGAVRAGLGLGSPLAVLAFGGYQVLAGELRLGLMLALSALAAGFLGPLSNLVTTALGLQELRSHIERIEDVMTTEPEQNRDQVTAAASLCGGVTLERVSFRYGPDRPWVLQDVSLEIRPGQKVAIVGRSGAGKSTLARMIVGLYRPVSGRVLYDGVDLANLDLDTVRSQVGVVTQGAHVFGSTLRANIALSDPSVDMEAVVEAARAAEIHDELVAMPMGYDTLLIDGGASLSGGQRQRVALARALVRKPAILLLDEATSDLDTVTESRVTANLAALDATRIVIAHRLSTIADADAILLLDRGRLVESGTHHELLEFGGAYAELVSAQARPGSP